MLFRSGAMYRTGQGVPVNNVTAKQWFAKAAEQGNKDAEAALRQMFDVGEGTPEEAFAWNKRMAELGHARSQYALGQMYESGRGVKQDLAAAAAWFRKAADQGVVEAQAKLAGLYREGRGVPQDFIEAYKWYLLASTGTPTDGAAGLDQVAMAKVELRRITTLVSPTQISEAKRRAREWKPSNSR